MTVLVFTNDAEGFNRLDQLPEFAGQITQIDFTTDNWKYAVQGTTVERIIVDEAETQNFLAWMENDKSFDTALRTSTSAVCEAQNCTFESLIKIIPMPQDRQRGERLQPGPGVVIRHNESN